MSKIRVKEYLHGDDESMYDEAEEIHGMNEEAANNYSNCLYEVEIELEVDTETGDAVIVKVDGRELKWLVNL